MYTVTISHYCKNRYEIISTKFFRYKKDAANWMMEQLKQKSDNVFFKWNTGNTPSFGTTDVPWESKKAENWSGILTK